MNINTTLLDETRGQTDAETLESQDDLLEKYDCWRNQIEQFITYEGPFLDRQKKAINIVEEIMMRHGKAKILKCVTELARVEYGIRDIEPWVRDHVVHALLSFVLGIFLNERFLRPKNAVGVFQWKLAGLLHDVGYPVQIAKDILESFGAKMNEIKQLLDVPAPDIGFRIVPVGLARLANGADSLNLIQDCLEQWDLDIDAKREYSMMMETGQVCHGMISALSVLYLLDLMYAAHNSARAYTDALDENTGIDWSQDFFDQDIVPACSAIFTHNLPEECFTKAKIRRDVAPLPFLLRLADCLQDWERPKKKNPKGTPATRYNIEVTPNGLIVSSSLDIWWQSHLYSHL